MPLMPPEIMDEIVARAGDRTRNWRETMSRWYPVECPHGYNHCPICDRTARAMRKAAAPTFAPCHCGMMQGACTCASEPPRRPKPAAGSKQQGERP